VVINLWDLKSFLLITFLQVFNTISSKESNYGMFSLKFFLGNDWSVPRNHERFWVTILQKRGIDVLFILFPFIYSILFPFNFPNFQIAILFETSYG